MTLQTVVLHTLCSFHPTSGRYTRVLLAINQIIIQTTCRWRYEYSRNTAAVTVFSLGHTALLRAIPMHVYTGPTKPADQRTLPFLQASSHSQVTLEHSQVTLKHLSHSQVNTIQHSNHMTGCYIVQLGCYVCTTLTGSAVEYPRTRFFLADKVKRDGALLAQGTGARHTHWGTKCCTSRCVHPTLIPRTGTVELCTQI